MWRLILFLILLFFFFWLHLTHTRKYSPEECKRALKIKIPSIWSQAQSIEGKLILLEGIVTFSISTKYLGGIFILKDPSSGATVICIINRVGPRKGQHILLYGEPKIVGLLQEKTFVLVAMVRYETVRRKGKKTPQKINSFQ